ncbi:MAG: PAS domain S-box protein [Nocardioides sp.]
MTRESVHEGTETESDVWEGLVGQVVDCALIGTDAEGTIRFWNAGAEILEGYPAEVAVGRPFSMLFSVEERDAAVPEGLLENALARGRAEHSGFRRRRDGARFWGDLVVTVLHGPSGSMTGFAIVGRDLTEQHALEEALRDSEERLRMTVDQVVDYAIIGLDQHGTIQSWNAGAERLNGYPADQAIGRHFSMFYPEEDKRDSLPLNLLQRAAADGRVEHSGWRLRRDGSRFWADVTITALHDQSGTHVGFTQVTQDRTEQHALEDALRQSEEGLRLLIGQVTDYAIIGLDQHGTIQSWNAGAERLNGYPADQAIGRHFSMFYPEEDKRDGLLLRLLDQAAADGRAEHTGWRLREDGTRFWGQVVITPLLGDDSRPTGFAEVTRDLTEAQRLESAQNSFFTTFAHDLRDPISALAGFIELFRMTDGARREETLDRIQRSAERLSRMSDDLSAYAQLRSAASALRPDSLDLAACARDALADLSTQVDTSRVEVQNSDVIAFADVEATKRVIEHLLSNAVKYSSSGPVTATFGVRDNRVRMTVTDVGRGIEPRDLDNVFNEFERGRLAARDGGTGLGLPSVRRLLLQQGGMVWISSTAGVGTTVTMELPSGSRSRWLTMTGHGR